MRTISIILLTLFASLFCAILAAQEGGEAEPFLPEGVQHAFQSVERDCPMCGWNWRKKTSNDKSAAAFEGAFKPGEKCPFCGGAGKVRDRIDWAGGFVVAYGAGAPETRSEMKDPDKARAQDFLMAKRAAELRATRNAVSLLANVRLNRSATLDAPSYHQHIEAFVKGAEHEEFKSSRDSDLPYYVAKVKLPLWGVTGLSERLWASYAKSYGVVRHASKPRTDLEDEYVIVIDARGSDCPPHLYPRVIVEGGTVVYDISGVNADVAQKSGMARFGYLEDDVPYDKLEESLKQSSIMDEEHFACVADGETYFQDDGKDEKKPKKRRRRKKIVVVKGEKTGDENASIKLTDADAAKVKEAEEKGDALKGGKVIILTDSRVAGKEGRITIRGPVRLACKK